MLRRVPARPRPPTGGDERVLTQREFNRALLARQGLIDGHRGRVPAVLDKIGGIQAQYAPAMYVGLWSRMQSLGRSEVTRALERRTAVQGTLLRSTIHLVSKADYWPTALAIRQSRRALHLRVIKSDPPEAEWLSAADRLRAALADGPMQRRQVDALVGRRFRTGIGVWIDLVRIPPSGTWERRPADLFGLAEDWVGPETGTEAAGVELLVRRYLGGFGPARPADIASWAGLPVVTITEALSGFETRAFRDPAGKPLVDLPGASLPDAEARVPVRFLPTWDATLLVHARRTLVLPEEHRPAVFSTKNPHSVGTFLVDGAVAGTWRYDAGRVVLTELTQLSPTARAELVAEAERLTAFHDDAR